MTYSVVFITDHHVTRIIPWRNTLEAAESYARNRLQELAIDEVELRDEEGNLLVLCQPTRLPQFT